jgi:hypothetical protein
VRLHAFRAGNQSLAMSLVNHVLRRAVGAGIPHLVLDHLALSLRPAAYEEVLARALSAWGTPGLDAVSRARELGRRRGQAFAFLGRLGSVTTLAEARELAREGDEAASLVLLCG